MNAGKWKKLFEAAAAKLSEEEFEAIATKEYQLGKVVGLEESPGRIREEAAKLFTAGKDDQAHLLRDLAKSMTDHAAEHRRLYMEFFKQVR